MAAENKVLLCGAIEKMERDKTESEIPNRINVWLYVMRRPQIAYGNRGGYNQFSRIQVMVTEESMIRYFLEQHICVGDFLEIFGVYCSYGEKNTFICEWCGKENEYIQTITYVHPLSLSLLEVKPKKVETVWLTDMETKGTPEEIRELLNERKASKGIIKAIKDPGLDIDGYHKIEILVQETLTKEEETEWFEKMQETSNRVFMLGKLCMEPRFNPFNRRGRVCLYQLVTHRKVFVEEDDPNAKYDYPWIISLGEQAESDRDSLKKGSFVYIDGSIQSRQDFEVTKVCETEGCGYGLVIRESAMEVVPYSVEYISDWNKPPEEEPEASSLQICETDDEGEDDDQWGES